MSCLIIIQARTASTRLPGKCLEVVAGEPLVRHALLRAYWTMRSSESCWLAVPESDGQRTWPWPNVCSWNGPEEDVLGRFAHVGRNTQWTTVVRLMADNPLVDPGEIAAVAEAVRSGRADYASNVRAHPWCDGVDVEAFTVDLLRRANRETTHPYDREHVTPWIICHAERPWHVGRYITEGPMRRWTIDLPDDLAWFRRLAEHIEIDPANGRPTADELLAFLTEHPELERWHTAGR